MPAKNALRPGRAKDLSPERQCSIVKIDTTERFASQLFDTGVTKTNALEALVIAGFVRGLSTRDIEAALAEALGEQAAISKCTVSRVCEQIKTQFDVSTAAES